MAVVEKLTIDKMEFYVDKQSQFHVVTAHEHLIFDKQDTYDLLNGLGAQLRNAEVMEPIWPFKKKK
jgi:hypothetical protein